MVTSVLGLLKDKLSNIYNKELRIDTVKNKWENLGLVNISQCYHKTFYLNSIGRLQNARLRCVY